MERGRPRSRSFHFRKKKRNDSEDARNSAKTPEPTCSSPKESANEGAQGGRDKPAKKSIMKKLFSKLGKSKSKGKEDGADTSTGCSPHELRGSKRLSPPDVTSCAETASASATGLDRNLRTRRSAPDRVRPNPIRAIHFNPVKPGHHTAVALESKDAWCSSPAGPQPWRPPDIHKTETRADIHRVNTEQLPCRSPQSKSMESMANHDAGPSRSPGEPDRRTSSESIARSRSSSDERLWDSAARNDDVLKSRPHLVRPRNTPPPPDLPPSVCKPEHKRRRRRRARDVVATEVMQPSVVTTDERRDAGRSSETSQHVEPRRESSSSEPGPTASTSSRPYSLGWQFQGHSRQSSTSSDSSAFLNSSCDTTGAPGSGSQRPGSASSDTPSVVHYHLTIQNCDGVEIKMDGNDLSHQPQIRPKTVFSADGRKLKRLSWVEVPPRELGNPEMGIGRYPYPHRGGSIGDLGQPGTGSGSHFQSGTSSNGEEDHVFLSEEGERLLGDQEQVILATSQETLVAPDIDTLSMRSYDTLGSMDTVDLIAATPYGNMNETDCLDVDLLEQNLDITSSFFQWQLQNMNVSTLERRPWSNQQVASRCTATQTTPRRTGPGCDQSVQVDHTSSINRKVPYPICKSCSCKISPGRTGGKISTSQSNSNRCSKCDIAGITGDREASGRGCVQDSAIQSSSACVQTSEEYALAEETGTRLPPASRVIPVQRVPPTIRRIEIYNPSLSTSPSARHTDFPTPPSAVSSGSVTPAGSAADISSLSSRASVIGSGLSISPGMTPSTSTEELELLRMQSAAINRLLRVQRDERLRPRHGSDRTSSHRSVGRSSLRSSTAGSATRVIPLTTPRRASERASSFGTTSRHSTTSRTLSRHTSESTSEKLLRVREALIRMPGVLILGVRRGKIIVTLSPDRYDTSDISRFMLENSINRSEYECGFLAHRFQGAGYGPGSHSWSRNPARTFLVR